MMKRMPELRLYTVGAAYTLWLSSIVGVFYIAHGKELNSLQIAVMGGIVPVACQALVLGVDWQGLVAPVKIWLTFTLVILLSYVANVMDPQTAPGGGGAIVPDAWMPIVFAINAVFIMAIGTLVAGCPDRRLLQTIAGLYAIIGAVFLLYVDVTGEREWGRLRANNIEPNWWGLIGLTVCLAALARKFGPVAIASFASGLSMILVAQSREHLAALIVVLMVCVFLHLPAIKGSRLVAVLAAVVGTSIATALLLDPYIFDAIKYINSDVLLLYSQNRGADSGFSGRVGIWMETLDLWLKHPLLGVGYRQHERFLAGWPAHNAYLAMLADTGLLGLIVFLVLLISSLSASWGMREPRTRRFVVSVIVSYIIIGFFDRRTIDAGNACSLFFVMSCSLALSDRSLRRAAELYRKSLALRGHSLSADPPLPAR